MDIKLYYTPRTRATRVRWLLEELQVPYQLIPVDLFGGEGYTKSYRAIHPLGYVPALSADGKIMHETGAICAWLTEQFPDRQLAPPQNSELWCEYQQWMYFVPGTLEPPIFYYLLHTNRLPENQRVSQIPPWCLERYQHVLKMLERELKRKDYMVGEQFTTADIMIGSILAMSGDLVRRYQSLTRYTDNLMQRPAFKTAYSD